MNGFKKIILEDWQQFKKVDIGRYPKIRTIILNIPISTTTFLLIYDNIYINTINMLKIFKDKPLPKIEAIKIREIISRKKEELLKNLVSEDILKLHNPKRPDGLFELKSGGLSNYYIDVKEAMGNPECSVLIVELLNLLLPEKTTNTVGSGLGGHTIASALMVKTGIPTGYDRGKPKNHGTGKVWEGSLPDENSEIVIVDDVFSSGTSVRETNESLKNYVTANPNITAILTVVNRSEPKTKSFLIDGKEVPIISIFEGSDFSK